MNDVSKVQADKFAQIIRNAQRNHNVYSVGGGMWQVQTMDYPKDGYGLKNLTWEELVDFSEKASHVPHDSEKVRHFNSEHFGGDYD